MNNATATPATHPVMVRMYVNGSAMVLDGSRWVTVSRLGERGALRGNDLLQVGDQLMANGCGHGDLEVIEVSDFIHHDGKRGPYTVSLAVGP